MSRPAPLVSQIRADALDPSVSTADLLRRVRVAISKLGIESASGWVKHEMEGYGDVALEDLPPYRVIRGLPRFFNPYNGWRPIMTHDAKLAESFSTARLIQPVADLERQAREGDQGLLVVPHSIPLNRLVTSQLGFKTETGIVLDRATLQGVVEKVRNLILDWSLELERAGVLGEGMSFTPGERTSAVSVTNNYFAQNIGVAGNVDGGSTVRNHQIVNPAIDRETLASLLQQLPGAIPMLPQDRRAVVQANAEELRSEAARPQPDQGRLRGLLESLRSICEGAGGNLAAAGIVETIKRLLG